MAKALCFNSSNKYIEVRDEYKNNKFYDGNTEKFGVTINNVDYIVKLPKDSDLSVYSEYIASNFICKLGIACHRVLLGRYKGQVVNLLEDFTTNTDCYLHSFKNTKSSSEDTDIKTKSYTYKDVLYMISKHTKMSEANKQLSIQRFWEMFLMDAILGNRDRHWGNWGYLANTNSDYQPAPIYDNGASLYPGVFKVIDGFNNSTTRKEFVKTRVFTVPACLLQIKKPDRNYRSNYYDVIKNNDFDEVFKRVLHNIKSIGWYKINDIVISIVDSLDVEIDIKTFYRFIVLMRYRVIICQEDFDYCYDEINDLIYNGDDNLC